MAVKGFFACPMRGDRKRLEVYKQIVSILEENGIELVSKHQIDTDVFKKEVERSSLEIYDRDYNWLREAKLVVAEITKPSSGVGGEVADAIHLGMPVLGLYEKSSEESVSAYLRGKIEKYGILFAYSDVEDIDPVIRSVIKHLK